MINRYFFLLLIAVFAVGCAGGVVGAMPEFSADGVMKSEGQTINSKVYFSNEKYRMDMQGMISITRMDNNVVWGLMPDQKMYTETKLTDQNKVGVTDKMPGEYSRVKIGKETVNGISCTKYKISYKVDGKESQSYQWVSDDGIMVKTAAIDNSWSMEYKNIKKGKQDPSLFEIPAGYKKFTMPTF